jgi:hypothetical protein
MLNSFLRYGLYTLDEEFGFQQYVLCVEYSNIEMFPIVKTKNISNRRKGGGEKISKYNLDLHEKTREEKV